MDQTPQPDKMKLLENEIRKPKKTKKDRIKFSFNFENKDVKEFFK